MIDAIRLSRACRHTSTCAQAACALAHAAVCTPDPCCLGWAGLRTVLAHHAQGQGRPTGRRAAGRQKLPAVDPSRPRRCWPTAWRTRLRGGAQARPRAGDAVQSRAGGSQAGSACLHGIPEAGLPVQSQQGQAGTAAAAGVQPAVAGVGGRRGTRARRATICHAGAFQDAPKHVTRSALAFDRHIKSPIESVPV